MPNNYFQFKQFRIEQEGVGMKVTTEGCILGGWVDPRLQPNRILDIGTGTGLLALMLAQKFPDTQVDAVELDDHACAMADHNFKKSPWGDRLHVHQGMIQDYKAGQAYDLIVCNPPFYNRSMESGHAHINRARHDRSLSQQELAVAIKRLLSEEGVAYVLYPPKEADRFAWLVTDQGFCGEQALRIYNQKQHIPDKVFRQIVQVPNSGSRRSVDDLVIRDTDRNYTEQFRGILKDYYLYM